MSMIFSKVDTNDVEGVICRITSVHPEGDAASEGFEYQMRGVGCITEETVVNPDYANKRVGEVRAMLMVAIDHDLSQDSLAATCFA